MLYTRRVVATLVDPFGVSRHNIYLSINDRIDLYIRLWSHFKNKKILENIYSYLNGEWGFCSKSVDQREIHSLSTNYQNFIKIECQDYLIMIETGYINVDGHRYTISEIRNESIYGTGYRKFMCTQGT